ncbi:MAG: serine/threonine protein kinase [Planctomycetaceae bacterium]
MGFLDRLLGRKPKVTPTEITKRFELICRVGQGSMSRFFKARDTKTGRVVGLKILDKEKTHKYEARFPAEWHKPSEGEIAVSLDHPNLVRTYEWGETTEGDPVLVMEYLEGVNLSFLVDVQNAVMQQHRLNFMIQLGEALAYMHSRQFIHRDLCPRNVVVTEPELVVKLIDFGLVVPNTPNFQAPGNRTGTAAYMAPELVRRQRTDARIDIYSYAMTCYEMFTRRHPWPEATSLEAVVQHLNQPPLEIQTLVPTIDPQVAAAIMKGLERDPAQRWSRVQLMTDEFRQAAERLGMPLPGHNPPDAPEPLSRPRPRVTAPQSPASAPVASRPPATPTVKAEPPTEVAPTRPPAPRRADSPRQEGAPATQPPPKPNRAPGAAKSAPPRGTSRKKSDSDEDLILDFLNQPEDPQP